MRVSTYDCFLEAIGMSSWQRFAHTAALLPRWNPDLSWLAGTWVPEPPPAPPPLVAPSLFPALYFLVERNKVTNHDAVFFQGK